MSNKDNKDGNIYLMYNELKQSYADLKKKLYLKTKQLEGSKEELMNVLEVLEDTRQHLSYSKKMAELGNISASVAHEISTPLGIGVTAASYLKIETNRMEKLYSKNKMKKSDFQSYLDTCNESVDILLSNIKHASDLIRSFKNIAVDQSNEIKRKINMKEYVKEVIHILKPELRKTNLSIFINCDDDLEVCTYPGVVSQIITNLIINSIKHGYNKGEYGNIKIEIKKAYDSLSIKYSDDGKGINKKIIDKIFAPFFTTNRNWGHSGLGLYIVYNIVIHKLKGDIKCESIEGQGAAFIVTFNVQTGK